MAALRSFSALVGGALAFSVGAAAQDAPPPTFKAHSRLVQVSVIVKRGDQHVGGLQKEDFQLFENGKPQQIATFEEVVVAGAATAPVTPRVLPPGHHSNEAMRDAPGATVLVIDAINTRVLDQTWAREQAIKFLSGGDLPKDQPFGLMVSTRSGLKVIHSFTRDPRVLIAALRVAKGEPSPADSTPEESLLVAETAEALQGLTESVDEPFESYQCEQTVRMNIAALRAMAHSLRGLPGRKTVLWVTAGFAFSCPFTSFNFADLSSRAFQELADANVSIYPVDVRGLLAHDFLNTPIPGSQLRNPRAFNQRYSNWFNSFHNRLDSLKYTAETTGGLAYYNTNGLAGALHKATTDASRHYLLGYYAKADVPSRSEWRQLQVKSRARGVSLRHRPGLYLSPVSDANKKEVMILVRTSALDFSGIGLTVVWPAGAPPAEEAFELEIASEDLTVSDDNQISVEVLVSATTAPGESTLLKSHTISGKIKDAAAFKAAPLRFAGRLDTVPSGVDIRFIVRDNLSGKMGSVTVRRARARR